MLGQTVCHYRILRKLGAGGMGEVYEAEDIKLGRRLAVKFLSQQLWRDSSALERFQREARSASSLNHPNICTVFDIDESNGQHFIAMELLEGETLEHCLASGPIPMDRLFEPALQIARALQAAHEKGILHRDIKPSNVFVTRHDQVKILDFGLAKLMAERSTAAGADHDATATLTLTSPGTAVGTVAYMSPEQALGEELDERSDIFSFGVVLYEMATGRRPFGGSTSAAVFDAILHKEPDRPLERNAALPAHLDRIICKCLQKDRRRRYASATELLTDLMEARREVLGRSSGSVPVATLLRIPRVVGPVAAVVALTIALAGWLIYRNSNVRWAREQALPKIEQAISKWDFYSATALVEQTAPYLPAREVQQLWSKVADTADITSEPAAADIYISNSFDDDHWKYIGRTPLKAVHVPFDLLRWKASKPGYATVYSPGGSEKDVRFTLPDAKTAQPGMVWVPADEISLWIPGLDHLPPVTLSGYWIDQYEVTNRRYKEFVTAGGYTNPRYWTNRFTKDGDTVSFEQAMQLFHDRTGRPGPATWELSDYAEGQGDYPVTGVSWYEAAAFAEFAGKSLPTLYHWNRAAGTWQASQIIPASNFAGHGPAHVGAYRGISPVGAYDMAGNVKEWCWNSVGEKKYILGGSWNEPTYMFTDADAQSPLERSPTFGFRLVKSTGTVPPAASGAVAWPYRDLTKEKPIPESVFLAFKRMYAYDKGPLDSKIESVDDTNEHWRKEKVSFNAAYNNERVLAYVFVPKIARPPFQTAVYFPGSNAIHERSSTDTWDSAFDFLIRSGRAVVFPIYKSTYERGDALNSDYQSRTTFYRDHVLYWGKDLSRTIDYIQTRADLDGGKLAYYGLSWGAALSPIMVAVEDRIKVAAITGGGLQFQQTLPEVDPINFAPRVRVPFIIVNGRYDFFFPPDMSQKPLYRLLGTPEKDKRLVISETGHVPPPDLLMREIVDWFDRYLGPVQH
jgi:eukaryotic-like serine/threonine-protein kinase